VVFEERRAVAVEYKQGKTLYRATAKREIILAGGTIETPRLLLLSGVGPGEVLRRARVPVVADVANVGKNFHDHPNVQVFQLGKEPVDCNYPQLYGFHRAGVGSTIAPRQSDTCYVFYPARSSFREGALKLLPGIVLPKGLYEQAGLVRAMRGALSGVFDRSFVKRFVERVWAIVVVLGKPKSRGSVTIDSARPESDALVDPAYFKDPEDMETMVRGIRLARLIASTGPAQAWGARELMPGARVKDDEGIARFVRKNVMTTYHYAGTCRMGEDASSVVDTRLKLRGVTGIRIADASVIPTAPVSAPNAPSMLIGLRAARYIREG
jgi:choline dehydrogenase